MYFLLILFVEEKNQVGPRYISCILIAVRL